MQLSKWAMAAVLPLMATAIPALAQSTVWDAAAQFTVPTPPANWAYMERTGTGCVTPGGLLATAYNPTAALKGYLAGQNTLVAKNMTNAQVPFSSVKVDANALWMHPGTKRECAVVRFKAPSAGTYAVKVTMKSIDVASPNVVRGYVFGSNAPGSAVGGAETLTSSGAYGTTKSFTRTISVLGANRFIDFALDDGANPDPLGAFRFDSTQVDIKICRMGGPTKDKDKENGNQLKECFEPRIG